MGLFKEKVSLFTFSMFFLSFFEFFFIYSYAQDSAKGFTELSYVAISNVCPPRETYPIVTEYEGKIFKLFRLPPQNYFGRTPDTNDQNELASLTRIAVGMEVSLGSADSGYKVNFLKNDVPIEKAPSHLTLAYGIAIEPPTGEDIPQPEEEPQPRKNEWINEGGEIDSPPIINVSKEFISKLCDKGQSKYWHSSYGYRSERAVRAVSGDYNISPSYCTIKPPETYLICQGCPGGCAARPHKKFETEVQKVTSIPDVYIASNGYEAHVIPFGGLRTQAFGGVQLLRAVDGSVKCVISCVGRLDENKGPSYEIPLRKKIVNGKEMFYLDLDEAAKSCQGISNKDPYVGCYDIGSAYFAYVDKIFFPDTMESVQADWLIRLYKSNGKINTISGKEEEKMKLIFQLPLQLAYGTPPEINFEYEIVGITGEEFVVSLKPNANDPDGIVESITWDFGNGEQVVARPNEEIVYSFEPSYYSVTATAYDNSGLKSKKVRVLNLSLDTTRPLFSVISKSSIELPPAPHGAEIPPEPPY
ncbi:MAG: PKD domain-containing protein [Candidatus Diapherotrites archaeon]